LADADHWAKIASIEGASRDVKTDWIGAVGKHRKRLPPMLNASPIFILVAAFGTSLGPPEARVALPPTKSTSPRLEVTSPRAGQRKSVFPARLTLPRSSKRFIFKKLSLPDDEIEVPDESEDVEVDLAGGAIRHEGGSPIILFFNHFGQFTGPARPPCALAQSRAAPGSSQRRFLSLCRLLF
jgi:hypothetical protein